ncbi:hypothetical protein RRG08_051257 [Elysia crispata]|uniref:Uncharacterized protein n=1 Tax=Elysia crispata TaxID=231223 RepID=A0AAE1A622_9GAST|nr:hypothetical protein RRG08_051257 [Elysia crispata]
MARGLAPDGIHVVSKQTAANAAERRSRQSRAERISLTVSHKLNELSADVNACLGIIYPLQTKTPAMFGIDGSE